MTHNAATPQEAVPARPIVFISIDETARRVGCTRRTIYRLMEKNQFPKSVAVTERRVCFIESEISTWQQARIDGIPL